MSEKWVRGKGDEPDEVIRRPRKKGGFLAAVHRRVDGVWAWHAFSTEPGGRKAFGLAPSLAKAKRAAVLARGSL
jgi:hypothetical protein